MRLPAPLIGTIAGPALRGLMHTWRFREEGVHHFRNLMAGPFVMLLWHESLLPLLWFHRHHGITIIVSEARDGSYLTEFAHGLGYDVIRGSSSRGGSRAYRGALRRLIDGRPVAFTPDGPRGPRRCLKPGFLRAAQAASVPILPLHGVPTAAWRLGSWDRLIVPKPLASVVVRYGEPFEIQDGSAGVEAGYTRALDGMRAIVGEAA